MALNLVPKGRKYLKMHKLNALKILKENDLAVSGWKKGYNLGINKFVRNG
jgi:hypothetical protein